MPVRIVKDSDGEFRLSFTPLGIATLLGYVAAQVIVLAGIYYSLKQISENALSEAQPEHTIAEEKASKDEIKHLEESDKAFESRLKRAEDDLGKQLLEIRTDVKQILRELPRTK